VKWQLAKPAPDLEEGPHCLQVCCSGAQFHVGGDWPGTSQLGSGTADLRFDDLALNQDIAVYIGVYGD